jgi:hypothetical protein
MERMAKEAAAVKRDGQIHFARCCRSVRVAGAAHANRQQTDEMHALYTAATARLHHTLLDSQASLLMLDVQGHRAHAVRTKALFRYENFLIKMSH